MANEAEFTLKGAEDVQRKLLLLAQRLPNEVARALFEEAEIEKAESMRRTPVDTGSLRSSHRVSKPKIEGRQITVTISVGGVAAPYAVIVHEDTYASHAVGQAKFLESTILESARFMAARVARRIELERLL